jgi:hypothetical protein
MLQPALLGGLVMGLLSGLPFISAGNCVCCLWVVLGGAVGAYVLQQRRDAPITAADGAIVGLLSGVFGSLVYLVVSIPITLLMSPFQQQLFDQVINNGDLPPEVERFLSTGMTGVLAIVMGFFAMLAAGVVFSTIGGVIGALIFKKSQPVAPPPPPTGFGSAGL